jgi:hypothetical protein
MIRIILKYKDANGNKYTMDNDTTMYDENGNSFTVDNDTVVVKNDYREPWVGASLDSTSVSYNKKPVLR